LDSLTSGTLYHYRLVATNTVGTAVGNDTTFILTELPPEAVTLAATNVGGTSAQLYGSVNPKGTITTYYFEYGTTNSYGTQTSSMGAGSAAAVVSVSATLSGLTSGILYHYRLVATNNVGKASGFDWTLTTAIPPTTVTLAATNIGATSVQLNGSVNPNGVTTIYSFEYGTTTSYGTQTSSITAGAWTTATSVSARLSNLRSSTDYHYRLVATNSVGTTQGSDMTFLATSVEKVTDAMPEAYGLSQNYPNPFNPRTTISYQLVAQSAVTLQIFDILGRHVATLVNESLQPGLYTVRWDASTVPGGVYFYQLRAHAIGGQAESFIATKKMILLK
jgi:phosphodiesterase/alkaline phosphatase D-like protein